MAGARKGFDFAASLCDGLVLSPALLGAYLKYSDPFYLEEVPPVEEQMRIQPIFDAVLPNPTKSFRENEDVGMYVGEGRFVHAPSKGGKVRMDAVGASYWQRRLIEARRLAQA